MFRKFILSILIVIFCSGCNSQSINKSKEENSSYSGDKSNFVSISAENESIAIKAGILPGDIYIVGIKDDNNFYYLKTKGVRDIFSYNLLTGKSSLVQQPINSKYFIKQTAFSKDWMVWVEDETQVETDDTNESEWTIYAKNLKTGILFEVDKRKKLEIDPDSISKYCSPRKISISNDKIVYTIFDELEDKSIGEVIKLYDLTQKKYEIIDYKKDYKDGFYSYPSIYENNIVWSSSICDKAYVGEERGTTFLYNIEKKQKSQISGTSTEILWPNIYNNFVVAREKTNGGNINSKIVLKDINKNQNWITIAEPASDFYKGYNNIETFLPQINFDYLIWGDNVNQDCLIYSINNNKIYKLAESDPIKKRIVNYGLFDKFIFWYETKPNAQGNTTVTHKYAKLK